MIKKEWIFCYESGTIEELTAAEQELVHRARRAAADAYAPYSHFRVGCALELTDDTVLTGNNQENASYPCGICAERTTLHHAQAIHPHIPIKRLVIVAENPDGPTSHPLPPCGLCRQALLEAENRQASPLRIVMAGNHDYWAVNSAASLLPLQFDADKLE